jgi:cysteine desulfurase
MTRHYLDHASTSPMRPQAVRALTDWLAAPTGDPGRVHHEGRIVRAALEEAREDVAALLAVRPRQVVFTSGGTEAVNAAVWGGTRAMPEAPVLCAGVEHSAVRDASARLAPVEELPVDRTGRIEVDAVADRLASGHLDRPALVHCQYANHEVGTVQPVADVVARCREAGVLVHVDACAAGGQVELDLGSLGADLVSVSAHKFGGPPGIGALVLRRGLRLEPLLVGGQQERARRAGMENVLAAVAFGAAARALATDGAAQLVREEAVARARTMAVIAAATAVEGVSVVGSVERDPTTTLPHIACLGVAGVEAEPVLLGLDRAGIAVHSGSACSSESLEPSPVLQAMGVDANHSLRVSVGWSTTDEDVDAFVNSFPRVVGELRGLR